MIRTKKIFLILILCIISIPHLFGQFYNGLQMNFGKNRVQYNNFFWSYYRYERFDTYFNQNGKKLAEYTAQIAENEIEKIEKILDYTLDKRLIFIVFNKLSDFKQSNIGLVSGSDEDNIGGVTQIINNKVFLYYEGNHNDFKKQIRATITEVIVNEMLYGNSIRNNIANSTLLNLPEWYLKGLYSYISDNWDIQIENKVKDGMLNGEFEKINHLSGEDAVLAGHSLWRYISQTYGESVIPNIIYLTKINKNANIGFLYVIGKNLKEISKDWRAYYLYNFQDDYDKRDLPEDELFKTKKNISYYQFKISPDGNYIAYVSNISGKYKIWIYNSTTDKKIKIFKKEQRLEQIVDKSYPVIAWHPTGKILSFITEQEGKLVLYYYTLETEELRSRNLLYFDKILDFSYSQDASKMVFSAVKDSKTDIYVHTLASATDEQITNDLADDLHPIFINNSQQIIFSSNRKGTTIQKSNDIKDVSLNYKMFIYDYSKKSRTLTKLDNAKFINDLQPYDAHNNQLVYLSDENGIINQYLGRFDSIISYIDTSVHYRHIFKSKPLSDYQFNINEHDHNANNDISIETIYNNKRLHVYKTPLNFDIISNDLVKTSFRQKLTKELIQQDSINEIKEQTIIISDYEQGDIILKDIGDTIHLYDNEININNYQFEKEKIHSYNEKYKNKKIHFDLDTTVQTHPKIRIYETSFYNNYLVSQIDYSFLDVSYQMFTGGAVYYNPGMNGLIKLGANDLFEDYRIVGGVRLSVDLKSNEYLLSFENLKKRVDKQYIFHRQSFLTSANNTAPILKANTHEAIYIMKYPFSQVACIKLRTSLRYDRQVILAENDATLNQPDINKAWLGLKLEYVFDNTRKIGYNLYNGSRFKIFGEAYQQINSNFDDLFVVGADFRNYIKINRNLIWANRFATSSSFGSAKLIYYLGSVDNWMTLNPTKTKFDYTVRRDFGENYTYQALATNMRGFTQNIRNGTNFAVINSEIRWPIFSYFANYPISSPFFSNFQLVSFFDLGSAWTGLTPFSGKNAYDYEEYTNGNVKVILDSNKYPIVAGYGMGVRIMLFNYFIRLDWARGIENNVILPRIFYLSLSLDF